MVNNLYWLDQIRPEHLDVGCQALHLSQLLDKGYPVLPGFTISAGVLRSFLETVDWADPLFADLPHSSLHLDVNNPRQLQTIARQLGTAIEVTPLPNSLLLELEAAAARLHSTAAVLQPSLGIVTKSLDEQDRVALAFSSAGILTSQVCRSQPSSLAQGLKRLWREFFSAKSLFYWQRLGVSLHHIGLAVLVQSIDTVIASGTACTRATEGEIRSTLGLGMVINQGEMTPDVHRFDVETGSIRAQHLGRKTIAYRIPALPPPIASPPNSANQLFAHSITIESLLETHLLDEQSQANYALPSSEAAQIVELMRSLSAAIGRNLELKWVLRQEADIDRLYLAGAYMHSAVSSRYPTHLPAVGMPLGEQTKLATVPGSTLIASGLAVSTGQAIAPAVVVTDFTQLGFVLPQMVLVVPTIPLDKLPLIRQAAAVVTEQGGMTSHSAIVAREIGVPAVAGVSAATEKIRSGEMLWVDGDRGKVYRLTDAYQAEEIGTPGSSLLNPHPSHTSSFHPPLGTGLMVNLSQLDQLRQVAALPVTGVGLLRAELLAMAALNNEHPTLWLQQKRQDELVQRMAESICQFAAAFAPRPVFYRSFDLRAHEFFSTTSTASANPMLGVRGTFSYVVDARLFNLELLALAAVQQAGYTNVHLMLPYVRTVEEFRFCRQLVQQAGLMQNAEFQLWIMAEVPSVLLLLSDYVQAGVQGISIGTNDLTQLLLGVDRDQSRLAAAFDERHPAVKRAIAQLVQQSHTLGIPCSICGEAPARYPDLVADLVQWGITSISVAPNAVESTYWAINEAEQFMVATRIKK